MKKLNLLFIFVGISGVLCAQKPIKGDYSNPVTVTDLNYNEQVTTTSGADNRNIEGFFFPEINNFNGTYQFLPQKRKEYKITPEMLILIENYRKVNEDVNLKIEDDLTVFILSKNKITAPDFKPLEKACNPRRLFVVE